MSVEELLELVEKAVDFILLEILDNLYKAVVLCGLLYIALELSNLPDLVPQLHLAALHPALRLPALLPDFQSQLPREGLGYDGESADCPLVPPQSLRLLYFFELAFRGLELDGGVQAFLGALGLAEELG